MLKSASTFSRKMAKARIKLIVSDLHLGCGTFLPDGSRNLLEEFHYDRAFAQWLGYYSRGDFSGAEVELILNGDILDHLHTDPREPDCEALTERVACEKTKKILAGHPEFFAALAAFAREAGHQVVYLMGNHDIGIAWPAVQTMLREKISPRLKFILDRYETDGVHVEHGNRFMADNGVDLDNLFLTRGLAEPVLKMPWGSFFAIHFINPLKQERGYIGKVFPFKHYLLWALGHDTFFAVKTLARLILYFLKINFIRDPKRNFSLWHTLKILREFSFPVDLERIAQKILEERPELRCVSFGHTHHPHYRQFQKGKEYLNTGSWNELIGLDLPSLGRSLQFSFAELRFEGPQLTSALLKEWKGEYTQVAEIL